MMQAPFGSVALNPSLLQPGFGPTFSGAEGTQLSSPVPGGGYGLTGGVTPFAYGFGWGQAGGGGLVPGALSTPIVAPAGITAPALLAAVAVRRGQPQGPASDQDVEEFIYDAVELLPGAGDVEVRCEGGRVALTGSVPHKRVKRDVGEIAWAIPGINDVNNTVTITTRRRSRGFARESESQPAAAAGRKQS